MHPLFNQVEIYLLDSILLGTWISCVGPEVEQAPVWPIYGFFYLVHSFLKKKNGQIDLFVDIILGTYPQIHCKTWSFSWVTNVQRRGKPSPKMSGVGAK